MLTRISDTLVAEPPESPFYFFLASAVASFLRTAEAPDRLFLARRGLLLYVLQRLQATEPLSDRSSAREPCSMQVMFDLLAELIRFCPLALAMMNAGCAH